MAARTSEMILARFTGVQHTVEHSSPLLKKCPHCDRTVLGSGLTCPYCNEPISETSLWQESGASLFERLRAFGPSGAGKKVLLASILVFLLLAVSSLALLSFSQFSPGRSDDGDDNGEFIIAEELRGDTAPRPERPSPNVPQIARAATGAGNGADKRKSTEQEKKEREEKIKRLATELMADIRKSEPPTTDTIYLKSGKEIHCSIIYGTGDRLNIERNGLTISIDKEKIERIESRTPEQVAREIRELALARATKIVDESLVKHKGNWVAVEQTPQHKLEFLLSVLRSKEAVAIELFGGELSVTPLAGAAGADSPGSASIHAFKAKAAQVEISEICDLLASPIRISGRCDVEAEARLDERDPENLTVSLDVDGKRIGVPPLDLGLIGLPRNRDGHLLASLSAGNRKIRIESFLFEGDAYNLMGNGVIDLARPVELSRLDLSFSIVFKKPPTLKDRALIEKGGLYAMDALVAMHTSVPIRIGGTLKKPSVKIAPGSSIEKLLR